MGSNLRETYIKQLVAELTIEGENAIKDAFSKKDYNNVLFNLRDSYASAVYVDGRLIKSSIRYLGSEMSKGGLEMGWVWDKQRSFINSRGDRFLEGDDIQMNGRDEAMDFLDNYRPHKSKGVQLIIIAAMFYANILESGGGHLKREYKVISEGLSSMENIAKKYGGKVTDIETGRVLSVMPSFKSKSWKR